MGVHAIAASPPAPAPLGRRFTIAEAATELHRSGKTVQNLLYKHGLPRILVRQGRHPRRIALLSERTLEHLRRLTRT